MSFEASVHAKAIELTKLSVQMTAQAGSGHPTSAASLAHLVTVLMYGHMRYDPREPARPGSDRLVLSEGHACPIVYAAAADLGIAIGKYGEGNGLRPMTREDALRLREIDSEIDGHPNPAEGFPFFPAATGSLGQGLSVAAGLAAAARLAGSDARTYCLIGDGESREGQVWEAIDFIVDHRLTAVCPIFNCNAWAQSDRVSQQQTPEVTAKKLQAAGFDVRVIDGHDPAAVRDALQAHAATQQPLAIVARTVKGWGMPSAQGAGHHGKPATGDDEKKVLQELQQTAEKLGARWSEGTLKRPAAPAATARAQAAGKAGRAPGLAEAAKQYGQEKALAKREMAPRRAFGIALRALGHARGDVVSLDADVKNSTYAEFFAKDAALAPRYFECRIAEQNMVSVAAGLASAGWMPFVSTFGKFVTRAYDQLEMALVGRANLKVVGTHVGVSLAADGPSQMALPDVAWFRALGTARFEGGIPQMYVLNPCDAWSAYALTVAMAEHEGPCYLRAFRPDVPFVYEGDTEFTLGGHRVLRRGKDLLVVATGYMVHETLAALRQVEGGVDATLVDLYSLPFDEQELLRLARANGHRVLTVEDNYGGGFGSAVAEALAASGEAFQLRQLHVRRIPKSGLTPDDVLAYLDLAASDVAAAVQGMLTAAR